MPALLPGLLGAVFVFEGVCACSSLANGQPVDACLLLALLVVLPVLLCTVATKVCRLRFLWWCLYSVALLLQRHGAGI